MLYNNSYIKSLKFLTGFTLVEIILTIVIASIIAAAAAPKIFSSLSYERSFYFNEVKNTISHARRLAVISNCHTEVEIAASNINILRRTGSNCNSTSSNFTVAVQNPVTGVNYTVSPPRNNVTITPNNLDFYFDSLGRARDSVSNNITNFNLTVGNRNLVIIGQTGLVYEP